MGQAHIEELIHIEGPGGVRLAGAVFRPVGGDVEPVGITWVHGAWDNFYVPTLVRLSRTLARCGYLSVTGNSRGHDLATALHVEGREPVLGGAWWEDLGDSADDVAAWVDCTVELGSRDVVLVGHSLGALKVIIYGARRCDPRVRGIVLASAPSLSALASIGHDEELRAQAEGMVSQGRGADLLPFGSVPPFLGTASAGTLSPQSAFSMDDSGVLLSPDVRYGNLTSRATARRSPFLGDVPVAFSHPRTESPQSAPSAKSTDST